MVDQRVMQSVTKPSPSKQLGDVIVALQAWPNAHMALSKRIGKIIADVEYLEQQGRPFDQAPGSLLTEQRIDDDGTAASAARRICQR